MPRLKEDGCLFITMLFLCFSSAIVHAQSENTKPEFPKIAQQLVREGTFAVRLYSALDMGTSKDEVDAESQLGEAGIAPRNGWIADYPVTPDIICELYESLRNAPKSGRDRINRDEALTRLDNVSVFFGIPVKPHSMNKISKNRPADAERYPNPKVIDDYYSTVGPPVVTYYAPPSNYCRMYCWIAYPFWWYDLQFPGFFILNNFHRTIFVNDRVEFVSNKFRDFRVHRLYRIRPAARLNGKTFAGIGVSDKRGFIDMGIRGSEKSIFNRSHIWPDTDDSSSKPSRRKAGGASGRKVRR
jgi:hypothetical protein